MQVFRSHSAAETIEIGIRIGQELKPNAIICLSGDLGAGKTTLTKGITQGVTGLDPYHANSPTFVYLNIYSGQRTLYHFDLYRFKDAEEFLAMGFDEYFTAGGVCCIEWSERIETILPSDIQHIQIKHIDERTREICLK